MKSSKPGGINQDDNISAKPIRVNNFMQEHPEEKGDTMVLLLKSKLQEVSNEKEMLEQQNKEMQEIIRNLEQNKGVAPGAGATFKETKPKLVDSQQNPKTNISNQESNSK